MWKNHLPLFKRRIIMARVKDFGSKRDTQIEAPEVNAGLVEYKMPRLMAEEIIKTAKGNKSDPQVVLCNYVNTFLGLKGYCVKVLVDL